MPTKHTPPPPDEQPDDKAKGRPYSIYLNRDLAATIDQIADKETNGNNHAVLQLAVRYFAREYQAGRIKLKKKVTTKVDLD